MRWPVFIGDTITITYRVGRTEPARHRTVAKVEVTNERQELVAVADRILQWVGKPSQRKSHRR
ncbi:MAG: hypothetical protein EXS38_12265 [Opitutus sp.]|nr:hypothetical protein [Opitutus sp.]